MTDLEERDHCESPRVLDSKALVADNYKKTLPSIIRLEQRKKHSFVDSKHVSSIMTGLNDMRQNNSFLDVALEVGDREIRAHKVVLGAFSPYFKAMFNSELKESSQEVIRLEILDARSVELLVDFAYTGEIEITTDNYYSLLETADFLQVHTVKEACTAFLKQDVRLPNCVGLLVMADLFQCPDLRTDAKTYALKHFYEICQMEDFLMMPASILHELLMEDTLEMAKVGETLPSCAEHEEMLLNAIFTYVNHQPDERKEILASLLACIRLPAISPAVLEKIQSERLLQDCEDCLQMIQLAQRWQRPRRTVTSFTHSLKTLSQMQRSENSSTFRLCNQTWYINLKPFVENNRKYLAVFVCCDTTHSRPNWSCHLNVAVDLLNKNTQEKTYRKSYTKCFNHKDSNWGFPQYIPWDELIDQNKGFIDNDTATLKVQLSADWPKE